MQSCIKTITSKESDDDLAEQQIAALEDVIDCCDKIDFAIGEIT